MSLQCMCGFGIGIDQLMVFDVIDTKKLIKRYIDVVGTENIELLFKMYKKYNEYESYKFVEFALQDIIENSDTIINFCKCQDSSSYVLIYDTMPWWMSHEDWKLLESPDDAKNYILNFLEPVLKDGYDKEQLMLWIGIVQDIYEDGEDEEINENNEDSEKE